MKPYLCPVCQGRGKVPNGFYNNNPNSSCILETCKSCDGKGILWGWDSSSVPDHPPWVSPDDGNTTSPPFTITWENPIDLDNLPPNDHGATPMNGIDTVDRAMEKLKNETKITPEQLFRKIGE